MELRRKRNVGIEGLACEGCEQNIEAELKKIVGVRAVKADHKGKALGLEYNLLNVSLEDIDKKIVELGYKLPQDIDAKAERSRIYRSESIERNDFISMGSAGCASCNVTSCAAYEKK